MEHCREMKFRTYHHLTLISVKSREYMLGIMLQVREHCGEQSAYFYCDM